MINREARMSAMAVASGEALGAEPPLHSKVALYGLLAKSLDVGALEGFNLSPARTFRDLWFDAGFALTQVAVEGYLGLESEDRQAAEELFIQRDSRAVAVRRRSEGEVEFGPLRIASACLSAVNREVLTLRTIARDVAEGTPVTERGVQLSGRVPLSLSLLHLYDLNAERVTCRKEWEAPQGDGGQVLIRSAAALDTQDGLRLLVTPEYADAVARAEHGPQIGCPASMVKGYIQEVHRIVANTAMESGLIETS